MRLYVCHAAPPWYSPCPGAEAVKIGVSADPFRRKWSLRRAGCQSPKLIWQSDDMPDREAYTLETAIKRSLARRCVGGTEWFDIKPDVAVRFVRLALRAGIGRRTLHRHFGPRETPAFGKPRGRKPR
jgi:hypothetical protein